MWLILFPNLLAQVFVTRIEKIVTTRSSFSSSPRMQGATHFEFSGTIWKTNSRTSLLTRSRPIVMPQEPISRYSRPSKNCRALLSAKCRHGINGRCTP